MGLNIKNSEAHGLASELAQLMGTSLTGAVIDALRARLEQLKREQEKKHRARELMAIGARCASHINQPAKAAAHGDMLYDETGMPK